ncbi:MAG: type II toxin-antitoxin system RelE/ParE family toxin [Erysipelotrichaceae bacterium]|nr:type II toxin-antitoxin system RelE/ParE family toxin [Erysipelotrichaceae bacterium]
MERIGAMSYELVITEKFEKSFRKLDRQIQKIIKSWIDKNLVGCDEPRLHGKGLTANRSGQWRYRIGDYRILADIQDTKLILILVDVGHRKNVY